MTRPPLIVIAGPTATGKTALSIALAEALATATRPVEIISADSRQVFRGLDIGTAKASPADRARVRHRGLDIVDPDERFSVGDFVAHADSALEAIGANGGLAILVGGTGLYLRAVARGLDVDALPFDPEVRTVLEAELADKGLPALVERLMAVAPTLATGIDLRNPRRVVRALEIATVAGDVRRPPARGYGGASLWLGLAVADPATHARWIAERARGQFEAGLVEEARALRERFDPELPAFSAIGYREAWAYLDGSLTLEAAIELDAARNRAFAKRQRTWFRAEPGVAWLDATARPLDAALALVRPFLERPQRPTPSRAKPSPAKPSVS